MSWKKTSSLGHEEAEKFSKRGSSATTEEKEREKEKKIFFFHISDNLAMAR